MRLKAMRMAKDDHVTVTEELEDQEEDQEDQDNGDDCYDD